MREHSAVSMCKQISIIIVRSNVDTNRNGGKPEGIEIEIFLGFHLLALQKD